MSTAPLTLPSQTSQTVPPQTNGHVTNGQESTAPLPKLPLPKLEDSCKRYIKALEGLQSPEEHEKTKAVVHDFLTSGEGDKWQKKLEEYNDKVDSYIEEFWCEYNIPWKCLSCRRKLPESL